jgi:thiol peroxidase
MMHVIIRGEKFELQKKQREVGSEAPAVKLKMLNNEEKVIGMMADKVQVIITLPFSHSLNDEINNLIHRYRDKANVYLVSSDFYSYKVNKNYSSMDFETISLKFGVYINDRICAKSIFIINKDGQIVYKDILQNIGSDFNTKVFEEALNHAINFKKKGHTHENWMSA